MPGSSAEPERLLPPSTHSPQQRSDRVKLRRGLAFLGMTVVLPGSAQLAAGNRRVGRISLRIWAALWVSALLVGVCLLAWRSGAVALLTYPPTLRVLQGLLIAMAVGWGLLLVDAWRLARSPELASRHRVGFAALSLTVVLSVVGGLVASASIVSTQRDLVSSVFAGGGDVEAKQGRFNILLLGADAGKGRVGLRPDSVTVASVDAESGRTVLVSLPRNMEDIPFPTTSPMHGEFPQGFGCEDHSCMLNAVYTYATDHKSLYPGVKDPGVQATKEAVEGATGLKINYYVLVDLKGFRSLVDAVGGIRMDVNKRVPIGGGSTKISGWIEPGRDVHLDGRRALWFARSRADSSDYERMARQKCVMTAMLNQLDPLTVLTNFNAIAAAGKQVVRTDIPTSDIDDLMDLALKAKESPVSGVAFVPPLIHPGSPDFAKMHRIVQRRIAKAEAADQPSPTASASEATPSENASQSASPSGTSTKASTSGKKTKKTAICAAR